jgi:hypothetical protein
VEQQDHVAALGPLLDIGLAQAVDLYVLALVGKVDRSSKQESGVLTNSTPSLVV